MQKVKIKAWLGDTVWANGIECEVMEINIKKEVVQYNLRNKKESPFDANDRAWFFGSSFSTTNDHQTIGFNCIGD